MLFNAFNRFGLIIVFVANPATAGQVWFLHKFLNKFAVASHLLLILPYLHKTSCARDTGALSLLPWYWTTTWDVLSSPLGMTKGQWLTFKTTQVTPNPIKWSDQDSSRVLRTQFDAEVKPAQEIMPRNGKSGFPEYLDDSRQYDTFIRCMGRPGGMKVPDGY